MTCHNVIYANPDTVQAGDPNNKFPQYIYGRSARAEGCWLPLLQGCWLPLLLGFEKISARGITDLEASIFEITWDGSNEVHR